MKSKKPRKFYYRLPPLGTLDDLISRSMALGFVLITLAIIAGTTWAFIELADQLDRRAQSHHRFRHLGHLPGAGLPAGHRGMARPEGRHHGGHGAELFGPHLGGTCRTRQSAVESMKLLITGVSHKTAPVEMRERSGLLGSRAARGAGGFEIAGTACRKR